MTSPDGPPVVYVHIGSNIEPAINLQQAVDLLRERCTVLAISSIYQTPPYGDPNQPDFLDVVAALTTDLSPAVFKMDVLRDIETRLGRVRSAQNKYGPLTLDMDIMLWGNASFDYGDKPWHVPARGILQNAADALPLAELAPDLIHPETGETLRQIADRLDATGIQIPDLRIV
jgi:2-amino-4-hydroxy-6-hydroxymethyldihydropteridine diphosphokinase